MIQILKSNIDSYIVLFRKSSKSHTQEVVVVVLFREREDIKKSTKNNRIKGQGNKNKLDTSRDDQMRGRVKSDIDKENRARI